MTVVTIYSRPGCHLCEAMRTLVARAVDRMPAGTVSVTVVDISTDAALERTYGHDIPVLLIDGRKAAKHRIREDELVRKLRA